MTVISFGKQGQRLVQLIT